MGKRTHLTALKQKATELLEGAGWTVGDAERILRVGHRCVSNDFMGYADLIAVHEDHTLAVQVTDDTHIAQHRTKMLAEPRMAKCLRAGWNIELWGFRSSRGMHLPPVGWTFRSKGGEVVASEGASVLELVTELGAAT